MILNIADIILYIEGDAVNIFEKLGIRDLDSIDNIIGIDLGHGESSAAVVRCDGNGIVSDLFVGKSNARKDITALYIGDDTSSCIGLKAREAVSEDSKGKFYIGFKDRPDRLQLNFKNDTRKKEDLVKLFFKDLITNINHYNGSQLVGKKNIILVGCPSGKDWRQYELEYSQLLSEGLQYPVIIMPESRAALIKVYQEHKKDFNLRAGTVVFDLGSSTFDCTYIDGNGEIKVEFSEPLGGNYIENEMLKNAMGFFVKKARDEETTLIDIRLIKEDYFDHPEQEHFFTYHKENGKKVGPICVDTPFMSNVINQRKVSYYSEFSHKNRKASWFNLCRDVFETAKREIGRQPLGNILLTGGASRMAFVPLLCKEVFGIQPMVDQEPSYCVSRGLALAGYTELICKNISADTKTEVYRQVAALIPQLEERLSTNVGEKVNALILDSFKQWAKPLFSNTTLQQQFDLLQESVVNYFQTSAGKAILADGCDGWLEDVKNIIANTVNTNFQRHFSNSIDEVCQFKFKDADWNRIQNDIGREIKISVDFSTLLDNLEFFTILGKTVRVLSSILIVPFLTLEWGIKAIFGGDTDDLKTSQWIDDIWEKNANQTFSKSKRNKLYDQISNNVEFQNQINQKVRGSIKNSLSHQEKQICDTILAKSGKAVEEAIDKMLLYR